MNAELKIKFTGPMIEGEIDLNKSEMVCIPSKPTYSEVDLCLKDGMNIQVGGLNTRSLPFEERKKLGYEIERRWNAFKSRDAEIEALKSSVFKKCREIENEVVLNEYDDQTALEVINFLQDIKAVISEARQ